jgi:hypothetical protein
VGLALARYLTGRPPEPVENVDQLIHAERVARCLRRLVSWSAGQLVR